MILVGDCRALMQAMPADTVQCVVTSPPYFGLRDYGVAGQIGLEGKSDCLGWATGSACGECFMCTLVAVFREVRRVLRKDGTCWVNLGDSYAGSRGAQAHGPSNTSKMARHAVNNHPKRAQKTGALHAAGIKPKDLYGIPWRAALALQADGWFLRQDVVWSKPNPMPESIKDRCTKAHEYLFLLSKSPRYFFDADAIKEPMQHGYTRTGVGFGHGFEEKPRYRKPSGWDTSEGNHQSLVGRYAAGSSRDGFKRPGAGARCPGKPAQHRQERDDPVATGNRNKRSVWEIPTQPFPEAHFATFPEALVEPCVLAGSRPGDLVLDPFMGAGTVAVVAKRLARRWIGCELNPAYVSIAERRIARVQPGLPLAAPPAREPDDVAPSPQEQLFAQGTGV